MGAKSTTISGLSGTGDIMLTCFVSLSRNRTVGVRLGSGETLDDILSSMNQVTNLQFYPWYRICWSLPLLDLYLVNVSYLTAICILGGWRCINCWSSDCIGTKVQCQNASSNSSGTDYRQRADPTKGCFRVNEPPTGIFFTSTELLKIRAAVSLFVND